MTEEETADEKVKVLEFIISHHRSRHRTAEYARIYQMFVSTWYVFEDTSLFDLEASLSSSFLAKVANEPAASRKIVGLGLLNLEEVFSPSWCERLCTELDSFQEWAAQHNLPIDR